MLRSPCELQIIFSFNFFVLKVFDYEISKGAIIHMNFIKHFPSIMIFKKIHPSKQLMSSSFYLSLKIKYEYSKMYEHQLINYYNHKS
jgi:hypothetical protein